MTVLHTSAILYTYHILACHDHASSAHKGPDLTCRHLQTTRLQPPFFSTGLPHFGQGLVLAASQLLVSLSSWIFCFHFFHLHGCRHV